jgi:hypothetical protein
MYLHPDVLAYQRRILDIVVERVNNLRCLTLVDSVEICVWSIKSWDLTGGIAPQNRNRPQYSHVLPFSNYMKAQDG